MARGAPAVDDDMYAIIRRVALDTIPSMRARLLGVLWELRATPCKTQVVADRAEIPTDTGKVWLDDLRLLGITDRGGDPNSGYTWALCPAFQETITCTGLWSDGGRVGGEFAPLTPLAGSKTGSGVQTTGVPTPMRSPDDDEDGSDTAERAAIVAVEAEEEGSR